MKALTNLCVWFLLVLHIPIFPDFSPEELKIRSYFCPSMEALPISDWKNPTFNDYCILQEHLKKRLSTILEHPSSAKCFDQDFEGWITYRLGRTQLASSENNQPIFNTIYINNNPEKKDKCIICYGSCHNVEDRNYIRGIHYIIKALKKAKFDGHFIYRIGGWPNLQKGRLKYADVPYAFKPFFFEEVRDMGYKKILWLDAASIPVKSLDPIFNFIEQHGCCFFSQGTMSKNKIKQLDYVMRSLKIPHRPVYMDILTQVVGFDLNNKKANLLLTMWIKAAKRRVPFLEPSADQASFAFLVNALNLLKGELPTKYYQDGSHLDFRIRPETIIFHQYDFLNPQVKVPKKFFR